MRTTLCFAGLLLLAGCQSIVGPRERSTMNQGPIADKSLSISEQERSIRDRLALPESGSGPRTYMESPWTK